MHSEFRQLRYGLKWLEPRTFRHARAPQRAVATELMESLGPGWAVSSRSHSRGLIAAATANPPITRIGIDVELADPRRPWRDIAAAYLPSAETANLHLPDFCRLWTFGEAWFKAFGANPTPDLLIRCARLGVPEDEPIALSARRWWWTEQVDEFWLSLVWEEAV